MMNDAYQYQRLEEHDSFRLLKISTSSSGTSSSLEYHYSLIHTRLDDAPPYETLSYVWGTTVQKAKLTLRDGTSLRVTKTLKLILPRIAHHCNTEYIWIDQICIDQHNIEERGQQVAFMGSIYSNCVQVIVRLDVEVKLTKDFRSIVQTAHRSLESGMSIPDLALLKAHISSLENYKNRCFLHGFWLVLASGWFSRAWVFQEVVLAPRSKIIISGPSTREETVTSLYELYWTYKTILTISDGIIGQEIDYFLVRHVRILAEMYNRWSQRHFGQEDTDNISFARLLSAVTSHAQTSLELDKLYAFFGLANQSSIVLRPDYKLTFHQALVTTVVAIIKGTLRLDVFDFKMIRFDWDSPSWVPDFSMKEFGLPFRPTSAKAKMNVVQDSALQSGSGIIYPWAGSCDTDILRVHGKQVDTIYGFIFLTKHFDRSEDKKSLVESIFNDIKDDTTHSFGIMSCTDQKILSALKADGWFDNTFDHLNANSQVNTSIQHEHSNTTGIDTEQKNQDWLDLNSIKKSMKAGQLCSTQQGLLAYGNLLDKGDLICILHGCSHPVVLRPAMYDPGKYIVRGTCYLEGWMDPWANGKIYWAEDEADEFVLV